MKRLILIYTVICMGMFLGSCNDFLDVVPDNRTEVNSESKITALLVSAYPSSTSAMMEEISSDNVMDNGANFPMDLKEQEEAYLWKDITGIDSDSPKSFWNACYIAIASANQALKAIEEMGNPANLQAQRGEALLCRAYAHFALANTFCLSYNPQTAATDMGIPYMEEPEKHVSPKYERGNMKYVYEKINADIEAGLPLINDDIYAVPKYHFNRKAAYAFAARFNLYYQRFDKVIEYANYVLGNNPGKVLRNWSKIAYSPSNWDLRVDMYISDNEPANLLLMTATSYTGYVVGPYDFARRYAHSSTIYNSETINTEGAWGENASFLYPYKSTWGSLVEKQVVSKIGGYFQYTDKVNRIGYAKNVFVAFSTDETLLCRAEAYTLTGELDKATKDINAWLYTHTDDMARQTTANIISIYAQMPYMPAIFTNDSKRSPKKALNPLGFKVSEGDQENMIHCILHLRRVETIHEGLRWQDIKRYGIEIAHNRDGMPDDILKLDDPRRAIQLPQEVIGAGLAANPR